MWKNRSCVLIEGSYPPCQKQYQHSQEAEEGLQLTINKFTGKRGPSRETYNFNIPFCPGLKAKKKA